MRFRHPVLLVLLVPLVPLATPCGAQASVVIAAERDTTLYFDPLVDLANGAGQHLFCGRTGNGLVRRGLLRFDVAAEMPPGSQVVSARLVLHLSKTQAGPVDLLLHRVLAGWGEGPSDALDQEGGGAPAQPGDATWAHAFYPGSPWATPGGEFVLAPSAVASAGAAPAVVSFASTALAGDVQAWLDGALANHGWLLRGDELTPMSTKRFDTREHPSPGDHPRLEVDYLPPAAVAAVGSGCATSAGTALTAVPVGLPIVPNPAFAVGVGGGPPGRPVFLVLADTPGSALPFGGPGCALQLDIASALLFVQAGVSPAAMATVDGSGSAVLPLPVPAVPTFVGKPLGAQVLALDPGIPGQLALSNALAILLGT